MQLTAVHSLQVSLDVLRKHRPDYTPRTGFVWPISDPSLSDDTSKTRKQDSDTTIPDHDTLTAPEPDKRLPKREQNNILLLNAMRTTAAHSRLSYTPIIAEAADAGAAVETPAPITGTQPRSSATPAPGAQEAAIKGPSSTLTSQSQEFVSAKPAGGGGAKKKKKRMCVPLVTHLSADPNPRVR